MQTLKNLCKEGHTVISSIHQPRSSIFAMFDDLILLSEGRMLYSGPADQALPYFEQLGHHCPQHYNPAEFLADIISVDASTPEAQQQTRQSPCCTLLHLVAAMTGNRMTCMLEPVIKAQRQSLPVSLPVLPCMIMVWCRILLSLHAR